jgi:hypothetical protein
MATTFGINFLNAFSEVANVTFSRYGEASIYDAGHYIANDDVTETIASLGLNSNDPTASYSYASVISSPIGKFSFSSPSNYSEKICYAHGAGNANFSIDGSSFKYKKAVGNSTKSAYHASSEQNVLNLNSHCRRLATRSAKALMSDNFGINVFGKAGPARGLIIDHSKSPLFIHTSSLGKVVQYASAFNYPAVYSWDMPMSAFGAIDISPNIIFPQEYTNPPLIFIVNSTGPISLYQFNKNAHGKYVSASIISPVSFNPYGWPSEGSFVSFSYYLVSEEKQLPTTGSDTSFGLQVFDANGDSIYRNDQIPAAMSLIGSAEPPYASVSYYRTAQMNTGVVRYGSDHNLFEDEAICINQISAATGVVAAPKVELWSAGYSYIENAIVAYIITGEYLSFKKGPSNNKIAVLGCNYTHAFSTLSGAAFIKSFQTRQPDNRTPIIVSSYASINQTIVNTRELKNALPASYFYIKSTSLHSAIDNLIPRHDLSNSIRLENKKHNGSILYSRSKSQLPASLGNSLTTISGGMSVGLPVAKSIINSIRVFVYGESYAIGERVVYNSFYYTAKTEFSGTSTPQTHSGQPISSTHWDVADVADMETFSIYVNGFGVQKYYGPYYFPIKSDQFEVLYPESKFEVRNVVLTKRIAQSSSLMIQVGVDQHISTVMANLMVSDISFFDEILGENNHTNIEMKTSLNTVLSGNQLYQFTTPRDLFS